MSYAIIINRGCRKEDLKFAYKHNKRLNKNYTNKNIDLEKSKNNYSLKQSNKSFEEEADNIINENNIQMNLKKNSYIACEYVITSDKQYFKNIGEEETKRYFKEAYNFVCNYRNLGEKYIISADIHMDEETPHMHLVYMPVVHKKDKENNNIEKLGFADFWNGKNSYKDLQDQYYLYIKNKNFDLERGKGGQMHIPTEMLKKLTNFDKSKKLEKENEKLKQKNNYLEKFNKDILFTVVNDFQISKEDLKDRLKEKYNLNKKETTLSTEKIITNLKDDTINENEISI